MTTEEKEDYRETVKKAIAKAERDIEELEELTKPIAPENAIGRVSRMDAINNRSVNEAALRQNRQKLIRLRHNLEAIDKSGFGLCARCKQPIPIGRLMLMPETNRCTPCARL
ncbi:MAG: TraR/DksA family transcriptional regulator [Owenweeksia sp.]